MLHRTLSAPYLFRRLRPDGLSRPDGGMAVLALQKSGIDAGTNSKYIIAAIRPFPTAGPERGHARFRPSPYDSRLIPTHAAPDTP